MLRSLVLTGGPGAGKTSAALALADCNPGRFILVPEAATQIYQMLHTRWSALDAAGRRDVQLRIYHLQIEQETRLQQLHPEKILLLDRETVDGAAYWPDGPDDYWLNIGTTHQAELDRYDAVIWLECSATLGRYDGSASNPCRSEGATAAMELDRSIERLWSGHRNFHRVRACPRFAQKLAAVCSLVDGWFKAAPEAGRS